MLGRTCFSITGCITSLCLLPSEELNPRHLPQLGDGSAAQHNCKCWCWCFHRSCNVSKIGLLRTFSILCPEIPVDFLVCLRCVDQQLPVITLCGSTTSNPHSKPDWLGAEAAHRQDITWDEGTDKPRFYPHMLVSQQLYYKKFGQRLGSVHGLSLMYSNFG